MSWLSFGGNDEFNPKILGFLAASTLNTALEAMDDAQTLNYAVKSDGYNWFVKMSSSANRTVDVAVNDERPWGVIMSARERSKDVWIVGCRMYGYADYAGTWHPGVHGYEVLTYGTGNTITLGEMILCQGDYKDVDSVQSGGLGYICYKDTTNLKVGFLY